VGEFIKSHRDSVVLATKYSNAAPGNDANAADNHRKSMMQALEASLKRLQTDYIDLYWVHTWDGITPEEVMGGLDDVVRQGKVLYAGISDAPPWWIAQANTLAELRGWTQFIGLQIEYSARGAHGRARTDSHVESFELGSSGPGLPWRKACCPGSITARVRPTEGG